VSAIWFCKSRNSGNQRSDNEIRSSIIQAGLSLWQACCTLPLWMLVFIFVLFTACTQMIILHLANYATDVGISPTVAATVISVIGIGSIVGRLVIGRGSDRIGNTNGLIICTGILTISLVWLIFSSELWKLYVFAIIFSFAYGGEVPLMTLLMSERFGLRAVSALVGVAILAARVGGALGSWVEERSSIPPVAILLLLSLQRLQV